MILINKSIIILIILFMLNFAKAIQNTYSQILNTNIPSPTIITIQQQNKTIQWDATIPLRIPIPQQLGHTYFTTINQQVQDYCKIKKSRPIYKGGDFIKFQKEQLGYFDSWPVQIIQATFNYDQNKIYALLTNGSIIISKLDINNLNKQHKINKFQIIHYDGKNQNNLQEQIWKLQQYDLIYSGKNMYLFKQKQLFKIIIKNDKTWYIQRIQQAKFINKIVNNNDQLYLIKTNSIQRIFNNKITQIKININNNNNTKYQFIDLTIQKNKLYILCKINGLIIVDKSNDIIFQSTIYNIDFPKNTKQIKVKNNTIFINYQFGHKTYIAQIFMINNEKLQHIQLKINKFYYRFQDMKKLVLYQNFALAYNTGQMVLFQHSINRKTVIGQQKSQMPIIGLIGHKIIDIIPINQNIIQYIAIKKNQISVEQVGFQDGTGIINSQIICIFNQPKQFKMQIQYEGFCKNDSWKSSKQFYCKKQNNYQIQINSRPIKRQKQNMKNHTFFIVILFIVFFLIVYLLLNWKNKVNQKEKILKELQQRRKRYKNQLVSLQNANQNGLKNKQENFGQIKDVD